MASCRNEHKHIVKQGYYTSLANIVSKYLGLAFISDQFGISGKVQKGVRAYKASPIFTSHNTDYVVRYALPNCFVTSHNQKRCTKYEGNTEMYGQGVYPVGPPYTRPSEQAGCLHTSHNSDYRQGLKPHTSTSDSCKRCRTFEEE